MQLQTAFDIFKFARRTPELLHDSTCESRYLLPRFIADSQQNEDANLLAAINMNWKSIGLNRDTVAIEISFRSIL
jgi:hypothetical protein